MKRVGRVCALYSGASQIFDTQELASATELLQTPCETHYFDQRPTFKWVCLGLAVEEPEVVFRPSGGCSGAVRFCSETPLEGDHFSVEELEVAFRPSGGCSGAVRFCSEILLEGDHFSVEELEVAFRPSGGCSAAVRCCSQILLEGDHVSVEELEEPFRLFRWWAVRRSNVASSCWVCLGH